MRDRRRRYAYAFAIYAIVELVLFLSTPHERLSTHTPFNHFALLADAWLHKRLDLGGPPPDYTGFNDFAVYNGKYFVSFPPMPAVLLLPFVAAAPSVDQVKDGAVFLSIAGI